MEKAARTSRPMEGMNFAFIHPRMLAATRQCLSLLCRTQTLKRIVSKPNPTDMRHKTGCGITSVCGSAAAPLRSGCDSLSAPLRSPLHFPDRRPQTEADGHSSRTGNLRRASYPAPRAVGAEPAYLKTRIGSLA